MIIRNAAILVGKSFVRGDIRFSEKIEEVGSIPGGNGLNAKNDYVIPGLVDIHTHGALGRDFSDGDPEGLRVLSDWYASNGVTSFLATTMTLEERELTHALNTIRAFQRCGGAKCEGVHLEGPFLCRAKSGAQDPDKLHPPDIEMLRRLDDASNHLIRLVTVACEEPGALDFIREAADFTTVSLGHSASDYETAMRAFQAGASHVTHLFNAMSPLHHREPGIVGAAFDAKASVELICDGFHVHPAVVRAAFQLFGEKVNLISDSLRCTGMPDGNYTLGGQPIRVTKGNYSLGGQPIRVTKGRATLLDGTLAGSSISLMDGIRRAVEYGIPLASAVYAGTTAPAQAVKLNAGSIERGKPADLVLLDRDTLAIKAVFISGVKFEKNADRRC